MGIADEKIFNGIYALSPWQEAATAYLRSRPGRLLDDAETLEITDRTWNRALFWGADARIAFAMECLETGDFLYGNQVRIAQHNIGGIGATNDGAAGVSNPNWTAAVDVFFIHLRAWCGLPGGEQSPRYTNVQTVMPMKGPATTYRSLGGRWAVEKGIDWRLQATMINNYGDRIAARYLSIFGAVPLPPEANPMRVAITSGHHNSSGGNGEEYKTTGILTPLIAAELRKRGVTVDVITPDEGRGMYPGSLSAAANEVTRRAQTEGMYDIYLETHTEGVNDPGVKGVFAIYPDDPTNQSNDIDTDVKNTLGPMLAARIAQRGKFSIRGNGVMSERATSVGLAGDRLGIFGSTAPIRAACTRLIIEYGSHTNPGDFKLHRDPVWQQAVAVATAECFVAFMQGTELPSIDDAPVLVIDDSEPQGGGPTDNPNFFPTPGTDGYWVVGPFYDYYHAEPKAMEYWGWPRSPEFIDNDPTSIYHGMNIQYFDRAVFHRLDGQGVEGVQLGLTGYFEAQRRGFAK